MRQRDLIVDETFYPEDIFDCAILEGSGVRVDLTLDDIEEIQGYIASAANHNEDRKLQKRLDTLFEIFGTLLDSYDDQDEI
jgi:hypothetical protein